MEGSHCEVKHTTDSSADSNDCAVISGSDWRGYRVHFSRLIEAIVMTTDAAGWDKTPSDQVFASRYVATTTKAAQEVVTASPTREVNHKKTADYFSLSRCVTFHGTNE